MFVRPKPIGTENLPGTLLQGKLLASFTNNRLGWKYLPLKLIANTCKLCPLKVLQHLGPGVNNVKRFFRQEEISWSV